MYIPRYQGSPAFTDIFMAMVTLNRPSESFEHNISQKLIDRAITGLQPDEQRRLVDTLRAAWNLPAVGQKETASNETLLKATCVYRTGMTLRAA